jgi:hypothetical protein
VVGQLSLFAVEDVRISASSNNDCTTGDDVDEATAERHCDRTVSGEWTSGGLAPDPEENPGTAIEKFGCPSCGLTCAPSRALDVCASCESAAVEQVHAALAAEGLPGETWALTDARLLTEAGTGRQPDRAARLLAPGSAQELARHHGRLVWLLADQVAGLELQVEDFRDQLGKAGYLQLVDDDSDALYLALADAEETQRARDVIAAHEHLFDDEDDVALVLSRRPRSWPSTSGVCGQLHEHEWTDRAGRCRTSAYPCRSSTTSTRR